jgi:outer membrane protein
MKEITLRQFLFICSLLFVLCMVPAFLFAAELKIGCIDLQRILYESEAGKKAKSEIDALIKSKQTVVDERRKILEKLKADLEKQTSALSAQARKSKQDEIEKTEREYLRLAQDSEAEIRKKDAELKDMILKDILELMDQIGKEEGYALIIDRGIVVYLDKSLDITDKVIKKYNEAKAGPKKR